MADCTFPQALARKWAADYAEYLFLTIALRELVRRGVGRGAVRGPMTARAVSLLETADQLSAFGLRPALGLAGAEAELWAQTIRYAADIPWQTPPAGVSVDTLAGDLAGMQAAWGRFEEAVGALPDDFLASSVLTAGADLRGESLAQLFGPRVSPTAVVGAAG